MNKVLHALLATLLSTSALGAHTLYSNQTYLSTRNEHSNAGMRWSNMAHHKPIATNKSLGTSIVVTPFYTHSTKASDLGKYFGMNGENTIVVSQDTITGTGGATSTPDYQKATVLTGHEIDHAPMEMHENNLGVDKPMVGTLTLSPKRESYGAAFTLHQSLEKLLPGLSLEVHAPVTYVKTTMGATADNARTSQVFGKTGGTISDYFAGKVIKTLDKDKALMADAYQDASSNNKDFEYAVSQAALSSGKIDTAWHSALGVADLSLRLAYALSRTTRTNVVVGGSVVLPTGNQSTGTHLFEPIYGNNGHLAAGLFGNITHELRRGKDSALHIMAELDWKYLTKATEKRTVGIYDVEQQEIIQAAPYRLGMKHEKTGVFPLANEITLTTDVTPGHHIEGVIGIAGHVNKLHFTLGYNFFTKDKETVSIKNSWTNDTIAFADPTYNMSAAAIGVHGNKIGAGATKSATLPAGAAARKANLLLETALIEGDVCQGPIQLAGTTTSALPVLEQNQVDVADLSQDTNTPVAGKTQPVRYTVSTAPATNGRQTTHSVVGGLSYKLEGKVPCIIGLGGQYEMAQSNNAVSNYKVWLNCGFNF